MAGRPPVPAAGAGSVLLGPGQNPRSGPGARHSAGRYLACDQHGDVGHHFSDDVTLLKLPRLATEPFLPML